MSNPTDGPKLHIDSDWKAQAQAEKERLAKLESEREHARGEGRGGPEELPPADFKSLVGVLASQALMGLGAYADQQGRVVVDLMGSRFAIDLLGVLEEKSKGNLTPEEEKDLKSVLAELRSRFVQIASMVADQMKAQGGMPAAGMGDAGVVMRSGGGSAGTSGVVGRIDPSRGDNPPPGPKSPILEVP